MVCDFDEVEVVVLFDEADDLDDLVDEVLVDEGPDEVGKIS